jgi:hypothetical protein
MMTNLIDLYNSFGQIKENTWLNGRSFSDAFVLCISSGPWRSERRFKIQTHAISFVMERDLSEINSNISFFPLIWQNDFVNAIIHYLQLNNKTMHHFCNELTISEFYYPNFYNIRNILYNACNCPNGAKVLSLFCRDSLKIPCFPIDRHVRKWLKEHNLPQKENEMVKLCEENSIDPRLFSLAIAQSSGIKNPDWSVK